MRRSLVRLSPFYRPAAVGDSRRLGKLKTERMVPVDSFVCELVQRLRFFCSLDSVPPDGLLLPRPGTKEALVRQLRDYLHEVCFSVGLPRRIVPHQLRHTYATEMLRSGVSFPGLMKLLGHSSSDIAMKYLDIALPDLQREFHLARSHPRHSDAATEGSRRFRSLRHQRRARFLSCHSTCLGNVPPYPAGEHHTSFFEPAF
jgi:integrase